MKDFTASWTLPNRLMLAAGITGFGLIALTFHHVVDGLTPFDAGAPWFWIQGVGLTILGLLLAFPRTAARAATALAVLLAINVVLHLPGLAAAPTDAVAWVSAAEIMGLLAAMLLIAFPGRRALVLVARIAVGVMLILFGAVHWLYVEAIASMIPDWMPGRPYWPWLTGAANITTGLALASGALARPAAALAGLMFTSWIVLVHIPRLIAAPGDRAEWIGLALAFALTGVVWTVRAALPRQGRE